MAIIDARGNPFEPLLQMLMAREQMQARRDQLALQEQDLALRKDALKIQQQEAEAEATRRQAEGVAGQTELGLAAQADPTILAMLRSQFPQTQVDPQQIAQMAAGAIRGQPQATAQAGSQVVRPQFDPRQIPVGQAAPVADRVRGFRQSEADLAQSKAQTESAEAQTRLAIQAERHAEALFPLERQNLQTGIAANQEQIKTQQATRRNLAVQDANESRRFFGEMTSIFGPAQASVLAFGTPTPPTQEQLVAASMDRIGLLSEAASTQGNPREAYTQLLETQGRTEAAQRVGLQPEDQNFLDQTIQRVGFTEAYRLAREAAGQEGSMIAEEDLPSIAAYLKLQYPHFKIPPEDVGFLRRLFSRTQAPAAGSTSPSPADPAASTRRRAGGGVM